MQRIPACGSGAAAFHGKRKGRFLGTENAFFDRKCGPRSIRMIEPSKSSSVAGAPRSVETESPG